MPWISTTGGPLPAIRYMTRWPCSSISHVSNGARLTAAVPTSGPARPGRNDGNAALSIRHVFFVGLAVGGRVLLGAVEAEGVAADHAVGVLVAVARVVDE